MGLPIMPKATAVWLVNNTALSFAQIADFCGMHELEVQAIADGDSAINMIGINPITSGQLTTEEIARCESDEKARLVMISHEVEVQRKKGAKYTPIAHRQDKPAAILWMLKNHPDMPDSSIAKLLSTTKNTINKMKDKNAFDPSIKPANPITLSLCTQRDLDAAVEAYQKKLKK